MKEEETKINGASFEDQLIENMALYETLANVISQRFFESDQHNGFYVKIKALSDKKVLFTCTILTNLVIDSGFENRKKKLREDCERVIEQKVKDFVKEYKEFAASKLVPEYNKEKVKKTINFNTEKTTAWEAIDYFGGSTYLGTRGASFTLNQLLTLK